MIFFVGAGAKAQPLPATNGVRVQTLPEITVLSIGVRGRYSRANYDGGVKRLTAWLAGQSQWRTNGAPYAVYWNPPFVPWFLRKSEIHQPVAAVSTNLPAQAPKP